MDPLRERLLDGRAFALEGPWLGKALREIPELRLGELPLLRDAPPENPRLGDAPPRFDPPPRLAEFPRLGAPPALPLEPPFCAQASSGATDIHGSVKQNTIANKNLRFRSIINTSFSG